MSSFTEFIVTYLFLQNNYTETVINADADKGESKNPEIIYQVFIEELLRNYPRL